MYIESPSPTCLCQSHVTQALAMAQAAKRRQASKPTGWH
jgi:hypothetical protein